MTIKEMHKSLITKLETSVGHSEAAAMADVILADMMDYRPSDLILHADHQLLPETEARILAIAGRVCQGEPLQYALGMAYFHGRMFAVSPATLIPRPETSQLVDIVEDASGSQPDLRILDIGTGSGCIAISLALDLPFACVSAIDISAEAIDVAKKNAAAMKASVKFAIHDILKDGPQGQYDIIVSNPPYVLDSERASMDKRVVDHEPAAALFVPDSDPIIYYKAIARYASQALTPDSGTMYFEINPLCADELATTLRQLGFADVTIQCDYKGNKRFAICRR